MTKPELEKRIFLHLSKIPFSTFENMREIFKCTKNDLSEIIDFTLTIIGGGELYEQLLEKKRNDVVLDNCIELKGFIQDDEVLRSYYLRSDIFVLPTYNEGFPRVLFDCMINKLPILTTMVGGIPGFLNPNFSCLELEPRSSRDLLEKLTFAVNNYDQMLEYADNAYSALEQYINSDVVNHRDVITENFDLK